MPIHFFYENTSFRLRHIRTICHWIKHIIALHSFYLKQLNYIFCDNSYLYAINIQYLNHSTYTDIVTFNCGEKKYIIESDIFISVDQVRESKKLFEVSFEEELLRVMIHGVLHLLGFEDTTEKQKTWIRKYEQKQISYYFKRLYDLP